MLFILAGLREGFQEQGKYLMKPWWLYVVLIPVGLWLAGCDGGAEREAVREYAAVATPEDPELAAVYERSCKNCHARSGSGAPLTGDTLVWQRLLENKGMQRLLEHAIQGYGGMPPLGHCMDCDREDFGRLIGFMATGPR